MRARGLSLMAILAVALPLGWCFGPVLVGSQVFAYRDAAHFYYPLESWISRCWSAGRCPLWNAQDGNGIPVVADVTSAVFYPGKLVFTLPFSFPVRFAWYVVLHLLLAAWGAYVLARRWDPALRDATGSQTSHGARLSQPAAAFGAISYALSGSVLFQHCNVVFLVGAAWLPWTLLAMHRMLSGRSTRWALIAGMCLALMVMGGDPQQAYHAGLLAVLYAILGAVLASRGRLTALRLLAVAAVSGVLLAAVQVVPAWSWIATSDRAVYSHPRSVYEIAGYLERGGPDHGWEGVAQGLWKSAPRADRQHRAFEFSVAPWRILELLWPNVSGRTFPANHRALTAIGGEDRIWTPSLYTGVLPLLLGIGVWRLRRADVRVRWFSWILLLALVGSFGWYGLGLLVQSAERALSGHASMAEPVGGLYWMMTVLLPGYSHFRYPAKLTVMASLALAMLAAIGFDRLLATERDRVVRRLQGVVVLSLLAIGLIAVTRRWWMEGLAEARPDEVFGPLIPLGAWFDALAACVHTVVVCGIGWFLLRVRRAAVSWMGPCLLALTAVELTLANGWLVLTAPVTAFDEASMLSGIPGESACTVYRWPSRTWVPAAWPETSSPRRAEENLRWDVGTLYAKLHLLGPHRSLVSQSTLAAYELRVLLTARVPHPAVLDLLGAEYLILPEDFSPPGPGWSEPTAARRLPNARLWKNEQVCPRTWIVHDVVVQPPWMSTDPRVIFAQCDALVFPSDEPRDFRRQAVVTWDDAAGPLPAFASPHDSRNAEAASITGETVGRVEVDARLAAPGLLVFNQYYDPRWQVSIESTEPVPELGRVVRTNRIMQGVFLPAGHFRLTWRYVPRDLYWSAAVSVLAWLVTLVLLAPWDRYLARRRG